MCGITGIIHLDRQRPVDSGVLERMTRALTHRGPDSDGFFVENGAGLGFQRLSIIDLEGGSQPLFNEDRSLVLLCNGEIFNYRELRARLEAKGHRFSSASDVEVILHLYEDLGPAFLDELNGQFAIALYDRRSGDLLLARDHLGINPVHWGVFDDIFFFGSEIKAILQHPAVPREVDLTGLDQVLSFPGLVSPRTLFKGIQSLKPGHYLLLRGKQVTLHEYWDLDYPRLGEAEPARSEEEYVAELRELFFKSVAYRLQADVPVGYYLSGGLDSSMIAAAIGQVGSGLRRKSFSVAFAGSQIQDRRNQRLMADSLGTSHYEVPFDSSQTAARLAQAIRYGECPVKETYNTCTLALSAAARSEGIPVVLTGEGADELFAGYVGYRFDLCGLRAQRPYDTRAALEEELRQRTWGSKDIFYEHGLYELGEIKAALYSEDLAERLPEFDCLNFELVDRSKLAGRHPIHCRSYLDLKLRLCDHLLGDHGDRMALANSVEARHPFLDIGIVEFARRTPPELKVNQLTEKYILRKVAQGLVPSSIAEREKSGWFAPGTPELLQEGIEWVHDQLAYERVARMGYFNPDVVEGLKRRYSKPGFRLNMPFESDLLAIVLTFNLFVDLFETASLN